MIYKSFLVRHPLKFERVKPNKSLQDKSHKKRLPSLQLRA